MAKSENPEIPEYIIRKIILLYGFCKEIKNKCSHISHPLENSVSESYFLINGEWLNEFKQFYKYNEIIDLVNKYNFNLKNFEEYKNNFSNIYNVIRHFYK